MLSISSKHVLSWFRCRGQCYDNYLRRFWPIFGNKKCHDHLFLHGCLYQVWVNPNFFSQKNSSCDVSTYIHNCCRVTKRVTRLGEVSPIVRLFSLHKYFLMQKQSKMPTFSAVKVVYYFWQNGLGNILGDFFTNSSGHPGYEFHVNVSCADFGLGNDFDQILRPRLILPNGVNWFSNEPH
jgi:hypothetical protein